MHITANSVLLDFAHSVLLDILIFTNLSFDESCMKSSKRSTKADSGVHSVMTRIKRSTVPQQSSFLQTKSPTSLDIVNAIHTSPITELDDLNEEEHVKISFIQAHV
jgi:hypothetical protein